MAEPIPDRRRYARQLVRQAGRGLAEQGGLAVTNNPASLFQLLCQAQVQRRRTDQRSAAPSILTLRDKGWNTAARLAEVPTPELAAILRTGGRTDAASAGRSGVAARSLAERLRATAGMLAQRYGGDLRRLRSAARRDPAAERALLRALPGVDNEVVDLFFREVQVLWPEIGPFADRRALTAARRLGLGRSTQELAALAGGRAPEKLAWLVGALVRIDVDGSYRQARRLATA